MNNPDLLALIATLYEVWGYANYRDRAVDTLVWAQTEGEADLIRRVRLFNCPPGPIPPNPVDEATEAYRQGLHDAIETVATKAVRRATYGPTADTSDEPF